MFTACFNLQVVYFKILVIEIFKNYTTAVSDLKKIYITIVRGNKFLISVLDLRVRFADQRPQHYIPEFYQSRQYFF